MLDQALRCDHKDVSEPDWGEREGGVSKFKMAASLHILILLGARED